MQQELTGTSGQVSQTSRPRTSSPHSSQHGLRRSQAAAADGLSPLRSRDLSPRSVLVGEGTSGAVNALQLDAQLRRLSCGSSSSTDYIRPAVAGQRISDYEKALSTPASRQPLGFKVTKRRGSSSGDGAQLADLPNEILTHILSHLHPDSHAAVALVSKRFYALVTMPHAWRMAFLRYFPGQHVTGSSRNAGREPWDKDDFDYVRPDSRYFARLTLLASWRSEYLLRTRLLRSVARGKPGTSLGSIGSSSRTSQSSKRASAVLTYNSKLPWTVSTLHAAFSTGNRPPRVVSCAADLGVGTASDPTTGRVEKWGLDDPFFFAQLDEMFPDLEFFGLGDGPAATPNVMDVSPVYGYAGGEGFPGGQVFYRSLNEVRGRYLGQGVASTDPDIPRIPELSEGITSIWIAKSSAVPSVTQSMVGIMAGSSLGVVTTYAIGSDSAGLRYSNGDMTARWALSPGVPIIALRVDDSYSLKRKSLGRVWAVALNALGEVFYLKDTPSPPTNRAKGDSLVRIAWASGRTVAWELIESTRRRPRLDDTKKDTAQGDYMPPKSSPDVAGLSREQLVTEARDIENFLRHKPDHFRRTCEGWDMRRRLEVDFAGGSEDAAGENIVVMACGYERGEPLGICRYSRFILEVGAETPGNQDPVTPAFVAPSLFGGPRSPAAVAPPGDNLRQYPRSSQKPVASDASGAGSPARTTDDWRRTIFTMRHTHQTEITTSGIDLSTYALIAPFEDILETAPTGTDQTGPNTPAMAQSIAEIPGKRSRLFAVGTNMGIICVWDIRSRQAPGDVQPLRVIQAESTEITCVALSALYLVHGGGDGLVQIWDPLASSLEPVKTLSASSSGRVPRHIVNANPSLRHADHSAVRAIFLDPDPTTLRGVFSFGIFLRYWTYSSTSAPSGRKRRLRHSDMHGRLASRRNGGAVSSYIAAEEAELRREQEHRARERARLESRFGVGLGDLTEEEALTYAEMISQESFLLAEQRRRSASDAGSGGDGDTASSTGSSPADTLTPDPSVSGVGPAVSSLPVVEEEADDDYEAQIQRAIRLSLMEGVNSTDRPPPPPSPPRGIGRSEYEFHVKVKDKKKARGAVSICPPGARTVASADEASRYGPGASSSGPVGDPDEDLALALLLSLEEEERSKRAGAAGEGGQPVDEFPALELPGKGKGKTGW